MGRLLAEAQFGAVWALAASGKRLTKKGKSFLMEEDKVGKFKIKLLFTQHLQQRFIFNKT
jgi:hypothetical protein